MTAEVIEGEAVEIPEPRALVVAQPGQAIVAATTDTGPTEMLARATSIATALAAMVEKQKLYTTISGRKYPQVEAWMTIGRMDNVVAREAHPPVRQEDGGWEAVVELVRLSDGMVIGNGSALCGSKGDKPWDSRPEHQRRSMAVTRATSRAFRQQYSWIMALAGYEPTPADEMPDDGKEEKPKLQAGESVETHADGMVGTVVVKQEWLGDLERRPTPEGDLIGFFLKQGRASQKVQATGALALMIAAARDEIVGATVTCWGTLVGEEYTPKGLTRPVTYQVLRLARIRGPFGEFPASEETAGDAGEAASPPEAPSHPLPGFDMEAVDREAGLAEALAS